MMKANLQALGGPFDNLWVGSTYQPGRSPLIVLQNTYGYSTRECMERWLTGEWSDLTFTSLFAAVICRRFLVEDTSPLVQQLAITNFVERILPEHAELQPEDIPDSVPSFRERLQAVRPGIVVSLGSEQKKAVVAATADLNIPCVTGKHPKAALYKNDWMIELVALWDQQVKPYLR